MNAPAQNFDNDNFPTVSMSGGGDRFVAPKGPYKCIITKVAYSPISEWPDWAIERKVEQHNKREDERAEKYAKEGKPYEKRYATFENSIAQGLHFSEAAEYVFFPRIVGGKYDGKLLRPIRTGITLNKDKKYRTKSNLYKLADAAMPDIEATLEAGDFDPRDVAYYPFMAQLDLTEKKNQKYSGFFQSEDHGQRMNPLDFEGAEVEEDEGGEVAPW